MDQCTTQTFCSTTTAAWHQWSTSDEPILSSTSFSWEIKSFTASPHTRKPEWPDMKTWQAQTQNQWAVLNQELPLLHRSCESRTGVSGHRAALKNSPAWAAAIWSPAAPSSPSWDGTRRCRSCAGCSPDPSCPSRAAPASPGTAGDGEHPITPGERGNHTLAHQLKHTFKHTTFSLRETIPLLSSTSVSSLTVCKKFKSALHFWYVRLSRGRNAPGHEILTTSAMASPLARIFSKWNEFS